MTTKTTTDGRRRHVFISHHFADDTEVDKLTALLQRTGYDVRNSSIRAKAANQRRLERGERMQSLEEGRPGLRNSLDRAEQFIGLTALLAAILAAVDVTGVPLEEHRIVVFGAGSAGIGDAFDRDLANTALVFVLVWMLARKLEQTADEVCDDFVLQAGSDRKTYARTLVEVAEQWHADPDDLVALLARAGFRVVAPVIGEHGQFIEDAERTQIIVAEGRSVHSQRLFEERFGFVKSALVSEEDGPLVQAGGQVRMGVAEQRPACGKGSLCERIGTRIVFLFLVHRGQMGLGLRHIEVVLQVGELVSHTLDGRFQ